MDNLKNIGFVYVFTGDGPKVHLLARIPMLHRDDSQERDFGVNKS